MVDLLGGVYQFKVDALPTGRTTHQVGAHAAATSLERMPQMPDLPTAAELSYPRLADRLRGYWPAGTPDDVEDEQRRYQSAVILRFPAVTC